MAVMMLVTAMILAGSSVVVGKILILTLPVFLGTFATLLVAFICMLPLMRGRVSELRNLSLVQWKYMFLQGLFGIVLFRICTLYGLHLTGAVEAGIITGTTPAVLAILSYLFLGERLNIGGSVGIIFAAGGCVLINVNSSTFEGDTNLLGCLLVGMAVVFEALFTICRKKIAATVSAITNTTILIFCSLVLLAGPALYDIHTREVEITVSTLFAVIYYGIFATVVAYLLWTAGVGKVSGVVAGAATAAMPASSVILAVIILGEELESYHLVGCLMIIAGIIVATMRFTTPVGILRRLGRINRAAGRSSR